MKNTSTTTTWIKKNQSELLLSICFGSVIALYFQLFKPHFLFHWYILLASTVILRFFIGTRWEIPGLLLGSVLHMTILQLAFFDTEKDPSAWKYCFQTTLILLVSTGFVLSLLQKFKKFIFPAWGFAAVFVGIIYSLRGLEQLPGTGIPYVVSILIWPFLLNIDAIHRNKNQHYKIHEFLITLCPLWFVGLFQNIPTEPGPDAFRKSLAQNPLERRHHGKKALLLLIVSLSFVLILKIYEWLLYGGVLFKIAALEFVPPWKLTVGIDWKGSTGPWNFFFSVSAIVIHMFLYFILISTFANSVALFLGFKMIMNERLSVGLKMARSWNLLMHYLNHLAKTIFFEPAVRFLKMIRSRKLRNFTAAIVTIYAFGICYLVFIPYGRLFTKEGILTQRFFDRCMYLILICGVAFFRIYGPRVNEKTWQGQILKYLIPALLIPIMGMGVLSLSSLH